MENNAVSLRGKKVALCVPDRIKHLENAIKWMNDPEVTQFVTTYLPVTRDFEEAWFDNLGKEREKNVVFAIETKDGKHIGFTGLHNINWHDRTAVVGAIIGDKEYWGKGHGTDSMMILLSYAFLTLDLRKVRASILAFNQRSLKHAIKCGYRKEGVSEKQYYKNGKYVDEILMAVFKNKWILFQNREFREKGELTFPQDICPKCAGKMKKLARPVSRSEYRNCWRCEDCGFETELTEMQK
ncbi:MAG: GNAT family N-acetyltransferase [Candidatus Niyogibacteria bacterium]|nr:MAG: GNAT family N-acetyltransferase [Candidatus Niyogibacteria bacterium]